MNVQTEHHDGVVVVMPAGRIDSVSAGELEAALAAEPAASARSLLVDLAATEYVSSAGLRVLLKLLKRLSGSGGRLILGGMRDGVRQVFEIAGFLPLFDVAATREEALAKLGQG